jgi:hypothetical protein
MSFPEVVSHQESLEVDNSKTRPFEKYVVNRGAIYEQADPPDGHYYYPQRREICGLRHNFLPHISFNYRRSWGRDRRGCRGDNCCEQRKKVIPFFQEYES